MREYRARAKATRHAFRKSWMMQPLLMKIQCCKQSKRFGGAIQNSELWIQLKKSSVYLGSHIFINVGNLWRLSKSIRFFKIWQALLYCSFCLAQKYTKQETWKVIRNKMVLTSSKRNSPLEALLSPKLIFSLNVMWKTPPLYWKLVSRQPISKTRQVSRPAVLLHIPRCVRAVKSEEQAYQIHAKYMWFFSYFHKTQRLSTETEH